MVDRVDINSVLMQMRQVKSQLRAQQEQQAMQAPQALKPQELQAVRQAKLEGQVQALSSINEVQGDNTVPNFQAMFKTAIDNVNAQQQTASSLAARFEQGDPNIDLPEVMIALQKSSVSFQAMSQVRNKLVDAYKEIMNMPV